MTATVDVTGDLAAFACSVSFDHLPDHVRERVKLVVLDAIASALAGHDSTEAAAVLAFAGTLGSSRESSVIGGDRMSPAGATVANGYLITAITVCDIHRPTTCHVSPEIVAPALVVAEQMHASGRAFLSAVAAGLEVTTRVGLGLDPPAFRARGWHAPGIIGPFGGSAAVGKLLGLHPGQQANAFGIAASQAAGTYAHLGTPTMKFQQARGALSGWMAAGLAKEGITASTSVLTDAHGGLYSMYSNGGTPKSVMAGIGIDWELTQISLRPWPIAVHLLPVVTGLLAIANDDAFRVEGIREVRVHISPLADRMHGSVTWGERFTARLSARYVTGVVIHDRRCGFEQFSETRVADPDLTAFIDNRVRVIADHEVNDGGARIEIETLDGVTRTELIDAAWGEPSNPLPTAALVDKFNETSRFCLAPDRAAVALDLLLRLEELPDVALLLDYLRVPAGRNRT